MTASYHLGPLGAEETRAYIEHRLKTVEWNGDPSFTDEAFARIHAITGGVPRKINTLRYEHLRLEASLPGYRPWKKTVYLKEAEANIDVTLVPIAKPSPRRAAPAANSTQRR